MITPQVQAEIEREIKKTVTAVAPLSAANNAQIYRLSFSDGSACVAKIAEKGLDIEAWMLKFLKEKSKLPVPAIYYSNEHIILMQFIETHYSVDEETQKNAAQLLADLHNIKSDMYGLERDTLIGSLHQPNQQTKDWVAFFTHHRLLYMAEQALKEGKIDKKIMKQVEKLAGKLPSYIKSPQAPSLIHGDVWSGNMLSDRGRIVAFLDPAIYYADPEIELAFIKLLNTFSDAFFIHYGELRGIQPGFYEERADIYSLYPLLVHTRLFGSSYARKVQRILDKLA